MATDADSKILITGDFDRTIAFPGGPTLVVAERYDGFHGEDVFVAALSPAGEHLWSRRFGDEDRQFGMAIAAKSDGDVVVTGNYGGSIDFQGSGILDAQWLPSTGSGYNVFLAALKG